MSALRVATRGSRLARWQAQRVIDLLDVETELVAVNTEGDRRHDVSITQMSGTGVFVKEVELAVLENRADIAVHSAKDLPSETDKGLYLGALPERADARDALAGLPFASLPKGARVGTGSVRRQAQLANLRPDLKFGELRGNIETRLGKVSEFDAVVLAACAVERLGLQEQLAEILSPSIMLPQVGQGALAVECRADDQETRDLLATIDNREVRVAVEAERAFLARLGGGCDLPVGALATLDGNRLFIDAMLLTMDGSKKIQTRQEAAITDAIALGERAAAIVLDDLGGREIIKAMT